MASPLRGSQVCSEAVSSLIPGHIRLDFLGPAIDAAGNPADERHDQILDERGGQLGERSSHDEGHGHVDEVAFKCKFFEFFFIEYRRNYNLFLDQ